MAWLEAGKNPRVGWREYEPDLLAKAAAAAAEMELAVSIHDEDCQTGKVGGEKCTCVPGLILPPGRA